MGSSIETIFQDKIITILGNIGFKIWFNLPDEKQKSSINNIFDTSKYLFFINCAGLFQI